MLVSEVATTTVVRISADGCLGDAVRAMHDHCTDYCVVDVDGIPSGIVTEHEALAACRRSGHPPDDVDLDSFLTGFEATVEPNRTVYYAVGLMISEELDVLPVKDGLEIVGVVTRADVLANLTALTKETVQNLERKGGWR